MKHLVFRIFLVLLVFGACSRDMTTEAYLPGGEGQPNPDDGIGTPLPAAYTHTGATFAWIVQMQNKNGLLESSEFSNFVSLYDNALAALVFIYKGELVRAERIFDYFQGQVNRELLQGPGGFYQFRKKDGSGGTRTWLGDNAWLLIALNQYRDVTGLDTYAQLTKQLTTWIRSLQDADGGLWGGTNEDGSRIPKVTEGIITAYYAVPGYDSFHQGVLHFLEEERWDYNDQLLITQNEAEKYRYALDLHSLGYLIFRDFPESVLYQAERYRTTQTATLSAMELSGYGFDEDRDVIWLEGTAQMAVAFRKAGMEDEAEKLLAEMEQAFIHSILAPDTQGLPYTTNHGSSFGAVALWDHADLAPALSSSIWYLFAKDGFNPLSPGLAGKARESDKFWSPQL